MKTAGKEKFITTHKATCENDIIIIIIYSRCYYGQALYMTDILCVLSCFISQQFPELSILQMKKLSL